jgi:hypothetical protein
MLVVVFGGTLNMAGIAASLRADSRLEVVCLDPHFPAARQRLVEIAPDAVTFDMSDPCACLDVTLLRDCPGLLLVGLDPSRDDLLVLSRESPAALSVSDLLGVINRKASAQQGGKS